MSKKWKTVKKNVGSDKLKEDKLKKDKKTPSFSASNGLLFGRSVHPDDYCEFFERAQKPAIDRTKDDILFLKLYIANVQALQSIPNFDGICRSIIHRHIPRGKLVVKNGDSATEAYIVATGGIDVELPNGLVVFNFKPGDFFGDYGLQNTDAKRTADCRARTDVDVIAVPRITYIKYMMNHMYGNRNLKKKFFSKQLHYPIYPKLPDFDDKIFTEQMNWMVCKSYKKGDVIGLQGHPSKKLYFVVAGVIRVFKTIMFQGRAVICNVGYYRKGQAFGATYTSINETNVHSWIADTNITLYMVNRADFQRQFGKQCVNLYVKYTNIHSCHDRQLRLGLKHKKLWNQYKEQVIDSTLIDKAPKWLIAPKHESEKPKREILLSSASRMARRSNETIETFLNDYE